MPGNNSDLERRLWTAADELRANSNLTSNQYATPVLGLIFLRFADARFEKVHTELQNAATGRRRVTKYDYQQHGVAEQLSEEQLALFDLLTRPNLKLSRAERGKVREVARDLLDTLKAEYLVLDWRKHQKTRASVRVAIQERLDTLPEVYDPHLYEEKCDLVYQHLDDSYFGAGKSVYSIAG